MRRTTFAGCALFASLAAVGCRTRPSATDGDEASLATPIGDPFVPVAGGSARVRPDAPGDAGTGEAAAPAPVLKTTVRLLDPGQAPRRKLRYGWRHDRSKETLTIDLRTTAATESEGEHPPEVALPSVRIVVAIDPRDATPDGDLTYDWHVTSTNVKPAPGSNPQLAESMVTEVSAIEHLAGSAEVSSRGIARGVTVDASSVADVVDAGATGEMVDQVRQTLTDLETPFPEEEVGKGARWEKVARLAARTTVVTQTDTFTLTASDGERGAVEDVLAQTAPPQELPTAGKGGAAPGPSRLEAMLATGTAKSRFDLPRIVPSTTYTGTTTMVVSGPSGPLGADGSRRVTMTLRVDIALSGSRP